MSGPTKNNVGTDKQPERKTGRNVRRVEPVETEQTVDIRRQQNEEAERIAREHPSGTSDKDLPERDSRGMLTRSAMEKIVAGGGSVMVHRRNAAGDIVDGRAVTKVEDLPSEADLSEGNADAEEAALRAIEDRQMLLENDRRKILSRRGQNAHREDDRRREEDRRAEQLRREQSQGATTPPAALHPPGGSGTASVPNTPPPPAAPPRSGQQPATPPAGPGVPHVPTEGE